MLPQLKRITDLFVEGEAIDLGDAPDGSAVVVWVNKPNSFQWDEARRDGQTARQDRILELTKEGSTEAARLRAEMIGKDRDALIKLVLNYEDNDLIGEAFNTAQGSEKSRENADFVRRQPQLLDDAEVPDDDPRRERLAESQQEMLKEFNDALTRVKSDRRNELRQLTQADLEAKVLSSWRDQVSMQDFLFTRRVTGLYFSLRICTATRVEGGLLDHSTCDHTKLLLEQRSDVRHMPDGLQIKVNEAFDRLELGQVEAGNSDVPATSSESSEPQSEPEESTPSTPTETSSDAPST